MTVELICADLTVELIGAGLTDWCRLTVELIGADLTVELTGADLTVMPDVCRNCW